MQSSENALERCEHIALQVLEDSLLFGPRTITDPETGIPIGIQGYDLETNQELLFYMGWVADSFERYCGCLRDLFFFEVMFTPDTYPEFPKEKHISQYLRIGYQNWLIKVITAFDCTLQALNSVFELGIAETKVNRKTFDERKACINNPAILNHVERIDQVLKTIAPQNRRSRPPISIQVTRNKLVHTNKFEHSVLSDLDSNIGFSMLGILDIDTFDLQAGIGSTGIMIKEEIHPINAEILKHVYPIFEYLGEEYKKRFKEKLIQ